MKYKIPRPYKKIGAYLKAARLNSGLTQKQVSDKLRYISAQFISNQERGISLPPIEKMKELIFIYSMDKLKIKKMLIDSYAEKISKTL